MCRTSNFLWNAGPKVGYCHENTTAFVVLIVQRGDDDESGTPPMAA
jgi:hypothetical protein